MNPVMREAHRLRQERILGPMFFAVTGMVLPIWALLVVLIWKVMAI